MDGKSVNLVLRMEDSCNMRRCVLPRQKLHEGTIPNRGTGVHSAGRLMLRKGKPSNSLVFCVAERFEIAFGASWLPRLANLAPMPNQLVGKQYPFVLRNRLHQLLFDLLGVGIG